MEWYWPSSLNTLVCIHSTQYMYVHLLMCNSHPKGWGNSDLSQMSPFLFHLAGEAMLYHIRCSSHKEKLENIQNILSVVTHKGVSMADIDAEG